MPNSALGKLARLDSTSGNGPLEYNVASKDLAQRGMYMCKQWVGGWGWGSVRGLIVIRFGTGASWINTHKFLLTLGANGPV